MSWGADTRLTNDSTESQFPSVSGSGQVAHVVWRDNRDGNYEIYYKRSTSGGISWGADTRLTNNSSASQFPSVSASGQVVHVAWQDNRDGNAKVYYKRSTDGGLSWGADTLLTNSTTISGQPSVSASGQIVHVVWWDYRDGHDEIYYKRSTDGGITWGTDTRLTNYSGAKQNPSVSVSGSVVHVVWGDQRNGPGNFEIYYTRDSTGNLFPPSAPNLVSPPNNSQGQSLTPLLAWDTVANSTSYRVQVSTDSLFGQTAFDTTISVTQVTIPPGKLANNTEYFWRASASNAAGTGPWSEVWNFRTLVVSTTENSGEPPETFSLSQNYPNPFNPSTRISFSVPASSAGRQGSGLVSLKVFDVLGREVATLVNENLSAGSYEVTFDARGLASGVYLYRLTSGGLSLSKKLLLTK
jgi:hypothetical protein